MGIRKIIKEEIDDFDWALDITPNITDCNQLSVGTKIKFGDGKLGPNGEDNLVGEVLGFFRLTDEDGEQMLVKHFGENIDGHDGEEGYGCGRTDCWFYYCEDLEFLNITHHTS